MIDDERAIVDVVRSILELRGYEVLSADDGSRGFATAQRRSPDVIVLDLMMPVMDGFAFRQAARRDPRLADIPVMVVSASDVTSVPRLAELDAAAFLAKPFELERFVAEIHRLC